MDRIRCEWPTGDELMLRYHDTEWGVPVHDDRKHFEFIVLDSFQAGLSWSTILKKREYFREAFDGFDPVKVAGYRESKVAALLQDSGIIRNRAKIRCTISNAAAFIEIQKEFGSFDKYIWRFTGSSTIRNRWEKIDEIPASTVESDGMSADLKKRGFRFIGSTICYAYMQAAGMVNDHVVGCFRYREVQEGR